MHRITFHRSDTASVAHPRDSSCTHTRAHKQSHSPARSHALAHALVVACCAFGALAFSAAASADSIPAPPAAPSEPVTDVLHGVSVADPYRNLEDLKNPQTRAWLKAQGDYAADQLSHIEGRDEIAKRIESLDKASGDKVRQVTRMPGERIYYFKRKVGEDQMKLMMRIGMSGQERVLVDPDAMSKASGLPYAINDFVPSWDGRRKAFRSSAG